MPNNIKVITFDLWDTIVADNSDEPKRAAAGMRSKHDERRHLIWEALNAIEPIDRQTVDLAFDTCEAGFNQAWKNNHVTWTVTERVNVTLKGLSRALPNEAMAQLVEALEIMEVDTYPDIIEGCAQTLEALSKRFKLAIASDAIVTPGKYLRDLLELHGVRQYFSVFSFSDEVGHSKPHRGMFTKIADELGVELSEMVHVGDRDHNDVKGPQALGMRAVLFTATRDVDAATTSADAVCESYSQLAKAIDQINDGSI